MRGQVAAFPPVAVVLGSGLDAFADALDDPVRIVCADLPHWPAVRVAGHRGVIVVGQVRGRGVAALAGRTHLYEGGGTASVTFAVRVLAHLGVRLLILTSASGGIDSAFQPGTLVVIDDHLNLTGLNPLVGVANGAAGSPFIDMGDAYAPRLRGIADEAAAILRIPLAHGVYAGVTGPSYETPAEIRALRTLGADLVGMSLVHETIAARYAGIEVLGLSLVTNAAAGVSPGLLHHDEVLAVGRDAGPVFAAWLEHIIERL